MSGDDEDERQHRETEAIEEKPVTLFPALGGIWKLAVQVAFSLLVTASNSVMALGWVGQFLKSEVIMSGVSLGR